MVSAHETRPPPLVNTGCLGSTERQPSAAPLNAELRINTRRRSICNRAAERRSLSLVARQPPAARRRAPAGVTSQRPLHNSIHGLPLQTMWDSHVLKAAHTQFATHVSQSQAAQLAAEPRWRSAALCKIKFGLGSRVTSAWAVAGRRRLGPQTHMGGQPACSALCPAGWRER